MLTLLLVATKESKSIKLKYFPGKREQKNLVELKNGCWCSRAVKNDCGWGAVCGRLSETGG